MQTWSKLILLLAISVGVCCLPSSRALAAARIEAVQGRHHLRRHREHRREEHRRERAHDERPHDGPPHDGPHDHPSGEL